MKQLAIIGSMVAGALILSTVLVVGHDKLSGAPSTPSSIAPPWQVELLPQQHTRALGITLGPQGDTLADVQRIWGANVEVALIAAPGENGAIEAFIDPAQAGGINGKLIVALQTTPQEVKAMRERALTADFMESTTRKYKLAPADLQAAATLKVSALTFIPQAKLDAQAVIDRFGPTPQRRRAGEGTEHFLYPDKGLDVGLNPKGKDVLQYVAPADFTKLSAPLK